VERKFLPKKSAAYARANTAIGEQNKENQLQNLDKKFQVSLTQ
jgi:hypothetical protein